MGKVPNALGKEKMSEQARDKNTSSAQIRWKIPSKKQSKNKAEKENGVTRILGGHCNLGSLF